MKKLILALFLSVFLAFPAFAVNKTLTFQWEHDLLNSDGTPADDLAGFRLYWSTSSGAYTVDDSVTVNYVPNGNTFTVDQEIIAPDNAETTFYFVVTAFDDEGNESGYSNEVSETLDFLAPGVPFNLTITVVPE